MKRLFKQLNALENAKDEYFGILRDFDGDYFDHTDLLSLKDKDLDNYIDMLHSSLKDFIQIIHKSGPKKVK